MTAREARPEPCLQRGAGRRRKLTAWQDKTFAVLDWDEDEVTLKDRYYQGSRNAAMTASQLPKRSGRIEHGD